MNFIIISSLIDFENSVFYNYIGKEVWGGCNLLKVVYSFKMSIYVTVSETWGVNSSTRPR